MYQTWQKKLLEMTNKRTGHWQKLHTDFSEMPGLHRWFGKRYARDKQSLRGAKRHLHLFNTTSYIIYLIITVLRSEKIDYECNKTGPNGEGAIRDGLFTWEIFAFQPHPRLGEKVKPVFLFIQFSLSTSTIRRMETKEDTKVLSPVNRTT